MKNNPAPAMDRDALDQIARLFKVFSDASRLAILQSLKSGHKSVGELVEEFDTTQANISKHLRVLHDAHILKREKQGTSAIYSIDDEFVFPLCELVCDKLSRDSKNRTDFDFSI
jgi:DNA-binding transcriptional ArsR family regulator